MTKVPHLTSDELPISTVVLWRHEVLHDVDEQPERVLLVHEEECYRDDAIKSLTERKICTFHRSARIA